MFGMATGKNLKWPKENSKENFQSLEKNIYVLEYIYIMG